MRGRYTRGESHLLLHSLESHIPLYSHHCYRKICRFLALPGPSLVLYKDCIEIETNLASLGDKDSLSNARKLYDSAVASYSQDVELWKNYYSLESKVKWILNTMTKTHTMTSCQVLY